MAPHLTLDQLLGSFDCGLTESSSIFSTDFSPHSEVGRVLRVSLTGEGRGGEGRGGERRGGEGKGN